MRYLLDTNMVSDLVRNPQGKVAARIARVGEESVCTSIIVAAELRYGAARKGFTRLLAQLLTVLDAFEILPFEAPAEITYGELRARLEATGQPIGGNRAREGSSSFREAEDKLSISRSAAPACDFCR